MELVIFILCFAPVVTYLVNHQPTLCQKLNDIFFFVMHYDIFLAKKKKRWWFRIWLSCVVKGQWLLDVQSTVMKLNTVKKKSMHWLLLHTHVLFNARLNIMRYYRHCCVKHSFQPFKIILDYFHEMRFTRSYAIESFLSLWVLWYMVAD